MREKQERTNHRSRCTHDGLCSSQILEQGADEVYCKEKPVAMKVQEVVKSC